MGMFKFDTQKRLGRARPEGVVRRINGVLPWSPLEPPWILRPCQLSDQACVQLPDLSTCSFSHSDGSPLSAPCPCLAHNARARRVAESASQRRRCLKSLVCVSVVCLSCLCMSVNVYPSMCMSLSMCPCVCRVLSMSMPMRHSDFRSCCLVCLFVQSCLPSLRVCPVSIGTRNSSHALRRSPHQSVVDLCVNSPM